MPGKVGPWRIEVGGRGLILEAAAGAWATSAEAVSRFLPAAGTVETAGTLRFGTDEVVLPGRPADRGSEGGFQAWFTDSTAVLSMPPATMALLDQRTAAIAGDPADAPAVVHRSLPYALGWVLGPAGIWVVHGAAVVPDARGPAILVIGSASAGKSTTAAAGLAAGWPVLGDDLLAVTRRHGQVQVSGIHRPLAVPSELGGPADAWPLIVEDPRARRLVGRPNEVPLAGGWWPIGAVAVVEHGTRAWTQAVAVPGATILASLWKADFGVVVPQRQAGWFAVAAELARRPAWRLELGADTACRLESTAVALRDIGTSSGCP
jgi:hypothetical protein